MQTIVLGILYPSQLLYSYLYYFSYNHNIDDFGNIVYI